ncbi:phospholipid carrier-dependent glycosyltransferase [Patescibacteria group bacterium]|nr:phospholipid carrier-dependent glycosyltransferase [Patescibacteria group bacterium]MBU1931213.1 phospholipid carrier-dependent glycosyltransferase [Patescibacteria group bacterium]
MKYKRLIFWLIIFLAVWLRFYRLGSNPPSLYWDEASLGYNAYSILTTGRDEHGEFLPLDRFMAFGDYKPPGYIYATVPFVWLFGLNEISVRLASALAGIGTVILSYFLAKQIFPSSLKLRKGKASTVNLVALIASFLLAISPWHLQMSRAAFEANLALFFNTAALTLFIYWLNKPRKRLLLGSVLFFMLAFYTFNANRIISLLLILSLGLIYGKKLWQQRKTCLIAAILSFLLLLPSVGFLLSNESRIRFQEVSIFNNLEPLKTSNQQIDWLNNSLAGRLLFNRRLVYGWHFLKHYFDHFEPQYLFISGDRNPRFSTQDVGLFYLFELPLLLIGFYQLVVKKNQYTKFLILWVLVALIPSALAKETPHALRTLSVMPVPQMVAALGAWQVWQVLKNKRFWHLLFGILIFINIIYYFHSYYVHWPTESAKEWQYGYQQAVEAVKRRQNDYDQIVITRALDRPYIYFLFYNQYPASQYWQTRQARRDNFGFWHIDGFGQYTFGLDQLKAGQSALVVAEPKDKPADCQILETINLPAGQPSLLVCEVTSEK